MKIPDVTIHIAPYGFPIRLELHDGRARVFAKDGEDWEDVGEGRVVLGAPLKTIVPTKERTAA